MFDSDGRVLLASENCRKPDPVNGRTKTKREWLIAAPHHERERFAAEARISPLLAQVLLLRGVTSASGIRGFLSPRFNELHPPEATPGALDAGAHLARAVRENRKIVIYGDYDVDGITATAILWRVLRVAGADVDYYLPSRLEEGYGVNAEALQTIAAAGGQVVVTVDCGITAVEAALVARDLGIDLIITDHHQPRETLPEAAVIVHPSALSDSPNPDLCGAGVALKVAWALARAMCGQERVDDRYREALIEVSALAAMGTIADVVSLTGENRTIAHFGLRQLAHSKIPGVHALIEVSGLAQRRRYDDYDVGFKLAPRINAIGRMGHAKDAVELLTRADFTEALRIAKELDAHNRRRQTVERGIVKQAEALVVERGYDDDNCRAIVLASEDWHPGVVGIVASRLVDRFHRPTVLIALENGSGQGSGRSIRHFPLHEALAACTDDLESHGGHAMAAGLRIRSEAVERFTTAFQEQAANRLTVQDLRPKLRLDDQIGLAELEPELVDTFAQLAPHGPGNARPRLATRNVELVDAPRVVGSRGTHLAFTVRENGRYCRAIAFDRADDARLLVEHQRVQVAFEPIINEWNGMRRVELRVVDWRAAQPES